MTGITKCFWQYIKAKRSHIARNLPNPRRKHTSSMNNITAYSHLRIQFYLHCQLAPTQTCQIDNNGVMKLLPTLNGPDLLPTSVLKEAVSDIWDLSFNNPSTVERFTRLKVCQCYSNIYEGFQGRHRQLQAGVVDVCIMQAVRTHHLLQYDDTCRCCR